jgi:hypothetical protein
VLNQTQGPLEGVPGRDGLAWNRNDSIFNSSEDDLGLEDPVGKLLKPVILLLRLVGC